MGSRNLAEDNSDYAINIPGDLMLARAYWSCGALDVQNEVHELYRRVQVLT